MRGDLARDTQPEVEVESPSVDLPAAYAPEVIHLVLDQFDAPTLRELAAVRERQDPARLARRQLTPEGQERLAEILARGDRPTIGFWRRYRAVPVEEQTDHSRCCRDVP